MPIPLDSEGFVVSFTPDQEVEYKRFFDQYGVVVVRDCLSRPEAKQSYTELWDFLERQHKGFSATDRVCSVHTLTPRVQGLKRDDPASWDTCWPGLQKLGILGNTVCLSPQFCENR